MSVQELEVLDLALSYTGGITIRLPYLKLKRGCPAALVGASGSGKSTLLECLGLLSSKAVFGSYRLGDLELSLLNADEKKAFRTSKIGFMPQSGGLIAFLTVEENIKLQLKLALGADSLAQKEGFERACGIAQSLGIADLLKRYPKELSLGQRQRAVFCRTVSFGPQIILIDEPTAALDPANAQRMFSEIKNAAQRLESFALVVTHDLNNAAAFDEQIAWSKELSTEEQSVFVHKGGQSNAVSFGA